MVRCFRGDIVKFKNGRDSFACGILICTSIVHDTSGVTNCEVLYMRNFLDAPMFDTQWICMNDIHEVVGHVDLGPFYEKCGFFELMTGSFEKSKNDLQKMMDSLDAQIDELEKSKRAILEDHESDDRK